MTLRTKNTIALSLLGTAMALCLAAVSFSRYGSFADRGASALATPFAFGAIWMYVMFNWFIVRTLSGIRLFGFLSREKENRKPVRQFSWLLLAVSPLLLAGPVWIFATQGVTLAYIVSGSVFAALLFFYLLVPTSNGTLARAKFKKEYTTSKK